MNEILESLADALRDEIEHLGHLLALLQEQQEGLFSPRPDAVLATAEEVEQVALVAQRFRVRREQLVESVAHACNQPGDITLLRLINSLPVDRQAMFEALVKEANRLVHATRKFARQNQRLLARTLELHRDTLVALRPDVFATTYDSRGGRHGGGLPGSFKTAV